MFVNKLLLKYVCPLSVHSPTKNIRKDPNLVTILRLYLLIKASKLPLNRFR